MATATSIQTSVENTQTSQQCLRPPFNQTSHQIDARRMWSPSKINLAQSHQSRHLLLEPRLLRHLAAVLIGLRLRVALGEIDHPLLGGPAGSWYFSIRGWRSLRILLANEELIHCAKRQDERWRCAMASDTHHSKVFIILI